MKKKDFPLWENSTSETLSKFSLLFPKGGIVRLIRRQPYFNDEPKLFDFSTSFYSWDQNSKKILDWSGGIDLSKEKALIKSLGEALERHCLSKQKIEVVGRYDEVRKKSINILEFNDFSEIQLSSSGYEKFNYNKKTKLNWCWGFDLFTLEKKLIPSQLIFVPYKYDKEFVIRYPITTGGACSTTINGAIYRGICEIIERDSFMIYYLNKLKGVIVNLESSGKELNSLKKIYNKYNLELFVVDITTDLQIPAMIGLVIDRTGIGPAVSVGLSADVNPLNAAVKAAKEALHSRPWIRRLMYKENIGKYSLDNFEGRALYWSNTKMIDKLSFFTQGNNKVALKAEKRKLSDREKLGIIMKALKQKELSAYFVDVTTRSVKLYGFRVIKALIPGLQPLYLNESAPYLGNKRLKEVPQHLGYKQLKHFNKIPHPFL